MRILIITFLSFVVILSGIAKTNAQEKQAVTLFSIIQSGEVIHINLRSPQAFYVGGNRYVLHIADKLFYRVEQIEGRTESRLNFLTTIKDFEATTDNSYVYLTYGLEEVPESNLKSIAVESKICWYLGKWDKSKLIK